jgi:hypothetical protein
MDVEGLAVKQLLWVSLLLLASTARAALVTFDVSGTGSVDSVSQFSADPSLPPGTTGIDPVYGP